MSLKSQLESLLFVSLKPLGAKELAAQTGAKLQAVEDSLLELSNEYRSDDRGLALIKNNERYQITTAAANAELIQKFLQSEATGELSQPSLEALTIIAYRGPIAKMELDRIRGVNCSLIVRNLLLRGLIEEKLNKQKDENFYTVTHDFIRFLGLNSLEDLPDYEKLHREESLADVLSDSVNI